MAGWKTTNYSFSIMESVLWRYAETSACQLQETMLKSDKIWCTSAVANSVRLETFWMTLVVVVRLFGNVFHQTRHLKQCTYDRLAEKVIAHQRIVHLSTTNYTNLAKKDKLEKQT